MKTVTINYRVLMKKEYFFEDLLILSQNIPAQDLDYQIIVDDILVKDFDNPLLDETNSFERSFICTIRNVNNKDILAEIKQGHYELDAMDIVMNAIYLLVTKNDISLYYCDGIFYMIHDDLLHFTQNDAWDMTDTWNYFVMWYLDIYGPMAADSTKIISYINAEGNIVKINSKLKMTLEIPDKNEYQAILERNISQ